jgi:hypothetical protein
MACNLKNDVEKLLGGSDKSIDPQSIVGVTKAIKSYKQQERAIDEDRVEQETSTVMGSIEQDQSIKNKIANGTYRKMTDKSAILSLIDNSFGEQLFNEMRIAHEGGAYISDAYMQNAWKFLNDVKGALAQSGAKDIVHQFEVYDASVDRNFNSAFWAGDIHGGELADGSIDGGHIVVLKGSTDSLISNDAELLFHEFSHSATEGAMQEDGKLNRQVAAIQKEVMKQLTPAVLLAHIENPTLAEQERAVSLVRYMNSDPSEFLAYAISNPMVFNAIQNMRIKIDTFEVSHNGNAFTKVIDKIKEVINRVISTITNGPTAATAINNTLGNIIMRNMQVKNKMYTGETFDDYASKVTNGKFKKVDDFMKEGNAQIADKLTKLVSSHPNTKAKIIEFMDIVGDIKGIAAIRESGVMQSIMHTMFRQTTDKDFAASFQLIRQVKTQNDKEQNSLKEINSNLVHSWFKDVSKAQRESITDLLAIDPKALNMSKEDIAQLLSTPEQLDDLIRTTSDGLETEYKHQARDLGFYMIHGTSKNPLLQTNAYRIYHRMYLGIKQFGIGELEEDIAISKIDKLATLYAMKYIDVKHKNHIVALINNKNATARSSDVTDTEEYHIVDRAMTMYDSSNASERKEFGQTYSALLDKGYLRKAYTLPTKAKLVPESVLKEMVARGWGDKNKVNGGAVFSKAATDMRNDGNQYYMMYAPDYSVSRTQGAIHDIGFFDSVQQMSDLYDGDTQQYEKNKELVDRKLAENKAYRGLESKFKEMTLEEMNAREDHLMAVVKLDGTIVDYSVPIGRSEGINKMNLDRDIASVLAATVTHRSAKIKAIKHNLAIVKHIISNSQDHLSDPDYVVIRKSTAAEQSAGIKYKYEEQWNMIPEYTREFIYSTNQAQGNEGDPKSIRIHKDMIDDFIGYKDASIAEFKVGKYFNIQDHPTMALRAEQLQYVIKKLVARYKTVLVILSPATIFGNAMSNLNIAMVHGIDPVTYIRLFSKHWKNIEEYNEIHNDLMRSESERDAGMKGLDDRIRGLQKRLEANDMHDLMKDGQFNMIIEDVDTHNNKEDHVEYYKRKMLEKVIGQRGGQRAMDVAENVALTKSSGSFKVIEKLTAYNDIINRKIVQEKMLFDLNNDINNGVVSENEKSEKEREILNYIDQLFVNYSYLDNKYIKYANDVGLVLFTKYFFRALKTVKQVYDRNPMAMTLFLGLEAHGDLPKFMDQGPQIAYLDPIQSAEQKVGPVAELDFMEMMKKVLTPSSFQII